MNGKTESFRTTIFENVLIRLKMPYKVSILLAAAFVGPLGNFLFLFSVSNNVESAFCGTFGLINAGESGYVPSFQFSSYLSASNALWYAFLFYVALSVRCLRLRLVKSEPDLVPLAPNGKKDIHENFKLVRKTSPPLVIMSIFMFTYATSVPELVGRGELTVFSTPIYILRSSLRSLMFGSVLWLYCASLWGLYRFGKQRLRLKPYYEDPMLGAEALGSLSFYFSSVYFLGLSLFAAQMILGGLAGYTASVNLIAILVLVPAGIILFVAPLVSTHRTMLEVKKSEIKSARKLFSQLVHVAEPSEKRDEHLTKLLTVEAIERKATSIRTWPVESPLMGKLALITTSVTAIMTARLIQILLQI